MDKFEIMDEDILDFASMKVNIKMILIYQKNLLKQLAMPGTGS